MHMTGSELTFMYLATFSQVLCRYVENANVVLAHVKETIRG